MRFALLDLELSEPLPALRVPPGHDGLGVVGRLHGAPVGFAMRAGPAGTTLDTAWLGAEMGAGALEAALREELAPDPVGDAAPPSLTVAVCTRDRPDGLRRCLESVRAATRAAHPPVDVLVVDNASTDDRTAGVAAALGVRCVREPVAGLDVARNRALAEARGDWLAFIDDDAVADPDWHRGFARATRIHAGAGAITGLVLPFGLDTEARIAFERCGGFRRGWSPRRWAGSTRPGMPYYPAGAGIFGVGCNMAFRRDVLVGLGGFDPALDTGPPLPGGGDLDIFCRVLRAGHPLVYEPAMAVRHEHRATLPALRRQYWTWGLGFMAFLAKTWAADPAMRPRLRGLVGWWMGDQLRLLVRSLLGRGGRSPDMAAAELAGGLVGLTGTYRRSRRRMGLGRAVPPARVEGPPSDRGEGDAPWVVERVDLGGALPALPAPPGAGGVRAVFWLDGVPLGSADLAATELPLEPRALGELAARVVAPAAGWHLVRRGFAPPLPLHWSMPAPAGDGPDLREVIAVARPLARLRQRFAAAAAADRGAGTSVVVCTRERPEALARCLASLARASPPPDEVLVVDNAPVPDAATRAAVDGSGVARYVSEPRPGLSAARNTGIRESRGAVIAFTDDDVTVDPAWAARIAAAVREPGVDAATGLVLPASLETEAMRRFEMERDGADPSYRGQRWDATFFQPMRRWGAPVWRIGAGANMAFRRHVFERLGGFDERLGAGAAGCSEDSEMWYRVLHAGGACRYDPTAVVHHHHREDLPALRGQMRAYMRGHVAALLVQRARYGDAGNLYRLCVTIPGYYALRATRALLRGFRDDPTLGSEIAGAVAGVGYYLRARERRPWPAELGGAG